MSPMLDLDAQQQHMTVFRLRFGEKGPKGAPRKLTDRIRVTSPSLEVVEKFVEVFGGETRPWDSGGKGPAFEAYLPTTEIPVLVLPGQSIRQSWERWRGGAQAERKCDGYTEELSGQACMCPSDIKARMASSNVCKPTTYVTVICPTVSMTWAGDFVSRGMTAAKTLPGSVNLLEELLARGQRVPATLRVLEHVGSRSYVIPVIIPVGFTQEQLEAGEVPRAIGNGGPRQVAAPQGARALEVGGGPGSPGGDPVDSGSVAGSTPATVARPSPGPAQPPLPHEIEGVVATPAAAAAPSDVVGSGESGTALLPPDPASDDDTVAKERAQRVAIMCREAGLDDEGRHRFLHEFSGGAYSSAKSVPAEDLARLKAALVRKVTPTLPDQPAIVDVPLPAVDGVTRDQAYWLKLVANVEQVGHARLLARAVRIAGELGVEWKQPSLEQVPPAVAEKLEDWIGEQG